MLHTVFRLNDKNVRRLCDFFNIAFHSHKMLKSNFRAIGSENDKCFPLPRQKMQSLVTMATRPKDSVEASALT